MRYENVAPFKSVSPVINCAAFVAMDNVRRLVFCPTGLVLMGNAKDLEVRSPGKMKTSCNRQSVSDRNGFSYGASWRSG